MTSAEQMLPYPNPTPSARSHAGISLQISQELQHRVRTASRKHRENKGGSGKVCGSVGAMSLWWMADLLLRPKRLLKPKVYPTTLYALKSPFRLMRCSFANKCCTFILKTRYKLIHFNFYKRLRRAGTSLIVSAPSNAALRVGKIWELLETKLSL